MTGICRHAESRSARLEQRNRPQQRVSTHPMALLLQVYTYRRLTGGRLVPIGQKTA
jgi:hypothetical protein